jgi:hypothetical protein
MRSVWTDTSLEKSIFPKETGITSEQGLEETVQRRCGFARQEASVLKYDLVQVQNPASMDHGLNGRLQCSCFVQLHAVSNYGERSDDVCSLFEKWTGEQTFNPPPE